MHYVYIIKSVRSGKLYIGFTNDLRRRLKEHNANKNISTKSRGPYELIYYEAYKSAVDAEKREHKIKSYGQAYRRLKERLDDSLK